jgi:hypothetical protein
MHVEFDLAARPWGGRSLCSLAGRRRTVAARNESDAGQPPDETPCTPSPRRSRRIAPPASGRVGDGLPRLPSRVKLAH